MLTLALHWLLVAGFAALMLHAALGDARTLEIPNWISIAVALGYLPCAWLAGQAPADLVLHYAVGIGFLLAGMAVFALGVMGGGDVKLMAAIAPWLDFAAIPRFLILVALLGGAVALGVIVLRRWPALARGRIAWLDGSVTGARQSIPYGIAIALAALWLLPGLAVFPAR